MPMRRGPRWSQNGGGPLTHAAGAWPRSWTAASGMWKITLASAAAPLSYMRVHWPVPLDLCHTCVCIDKDVLPNFDPRTASP